MTELELLESIAGKLDLLTWWAAVGAVGCNMLAGLQIVLLLLRGKDSRKWW